MSPPRRTLFIKAILDQMGLPYGWDLKGLEGEPYIGRDCSGTVTSALASIGGPDWRASHNCQRLWNELPARTAALPGDLCLYGPPDAIHHVMTVIYDPEDGSDLVVVGAAGGDHTFTSLEIARAHPGAKVQAWDSHLDMRDFAGFRAIPWLDL